jgi:crotonobetainyl-CoA hydratase
MPQTVHVTRHGALYQITLDRPSTNAIDAATSRALFVAFRAFNDDPDARVAILTGAGDRFFSAGWDFDAAAAGEGAEASDSDHGPGGFAGLTEFFTLEKPVIAAVNGLAIGGGFELALACDLIVASENAEFALPEAGLGLVADAGGVQRLPRRIAANLAMELLLTGRRIDAAEAKRIGLANQVAPLGSLMTAARALATTIAAKAPLSIRAIKALARAGEGLSIEATFEAMRSGRVPAYSAAIASDDAREGPRAFTENRPPVWTGR